MYNIFLKEPRMWMYTQILSMFFISAYTYPEFMKTTWLKTFIRPFTMNLILFLQTLYDTYRGCHDETSFVCLSFCLPCHFSSPVIGWYRSVWLYCSALIGQISGTLRSFVGLSRASHPQVCPSTHVQCWNKQQYKCFNQSMCSLSLDKHAVAHLTLMNQTRCP